MSRNIKKEREQEVYDVDEYEQPEKKSDAFFNRYATKKTFSNALTDGALLATNAAQLRVLLSDGFLDTKDPKWFISIILVSCSLGAQLLVLILLGLLAKSNLANKAKKSYIDAMNDIVLVLSGIIFCLNIVTTVFIQVDFGDLLNKATTLFPTTTAPIPGLNPI